MKYLLILGLLVGCGSKGDMQDNIREFTNSCEQLAECMEKGYKVEMELNMPYQMVCKIKYSKITTAYLRVRDFDIEHRPTFGYDFFEPAIETCNMLKKRGGYSDAEQDEKYRYVKCVKIASESEAQKRACWEQYRNGEFKKSK